MSNELTLIKSNPLLPAEDYTNLRKEGRDAIERLGHELWDNYNDSEPGITMLEAVSYAITDLAYRMGFEVKDLLAPERLTPTTWNQIFYTARQILHNSPLTITDCRKLLLDIKGVRNAWIEPSKEYEVPLWIDYAHTETKVEDDCGCSDKKTTKQCYGKLTLTQEHVDPCPPTALDLKIVELEGLYNVMIEYEEDVLDQGQREDVRRQVFARLAKHRNLCEDILSINAVEYLDFGIAASFELEEDADPDRVLAEIFFAIYSYFTPSIPFHTIDEMIADKGYSIDEIFNGPALKHGFIDSVELEATDLFRDIHLSDILHLIADIDGIKAITYFQLPFDINTPPAKSVQQYFTEWVEQLKEQRKIARIVPTLSQIIFCKQREFITYWMNKPSDRLPDRVLKLFKDKKALERKYRLIGHEVDLPVPTGEYMELENYYPVTYSLPMNYSVSERAGMPPDTDPIGKIKALQLKGFLMFFEQLLLDHLVQLNNLRNLFSFDDSVHRTYYTRALREIDGLTDLLVDYGNHHSHPHLSPQQIEQKIIHDFESALHSIVEPPAVFDERRNRFLSHLLARFSEDMSGYESIDRSLWSPHSGERYITDKIHLLKDGEYYKISTNRGVGYDYTQQSIWDTGNISGAERRISRLLGFDTVSRRTLSPTFIISEPELVIDPTTKQQVPFVDPDGHHHNIIKILDPSNEQTILLTSKSVVDGCCTQELTDSIIEYASDKKYFRFDDELQPGIRTSASKVGKFSFQLYDGTTEDATMIASSPHYRTKEECMEAFKTLEAAIALINKNEGFHLVEHLLLRPKLDIEQDEYDNRINPTLLDVCLDDCDLGRGLNEYTEIPICKKEVIRIPAAKCFDNKPWELHYFLYDPKTKTYGTRTFLYQSISSDSSEAVKLTFARYEKLTQRVFDLAEFGSERANYTIVSNNATPANYSFIIHGRNGEVLAQSEYLFTWDPADKPGHPAKADDTLDIEYVIAALQSYFGFQQDLYCEADACDNNEDPYSFRTTAVIPCWPQRLRDKTFRHLVEKTIQQESPAHVHTRIVWVGIDEMRRFETAYADWLQEMAQTEMPSYEKTNPLIEVLNTLKPCGPCEDECA